jgi:hypothetical protein
MIFFTGSDVDGASDTKRSIIDLNLQVMLSCCLDYPRRTRPLEVKQNNELQAGYISNNLFC